MPSPTGWRGIEHKLATVHERRGEWELGRAPLQEALALGGPPRGCRPTAAWWPAGAATPASAAALAARRCGWPRPRATTRPPRRRTTSSGLLGAGRAATSSAASRSSERLADPGIRIAALNNLALVRGRDGDLERAPRRSIARGARRSCAAQGDRHREAALRNNLADMLHRAGRDDEAMEELKRAVAIFAEIGGDEEGPQPGVWRLVEW